MQDKIANLDVFVTLRKQVQHVQYYIEISCDDDCIITDACGSVSARTVARLLVGDGKCILEPAVAITKLIVMPLL